MVCFNVIANAQISKGSTFLGGSVSYNTGESENENNTQYKSESTSFGIRPQFGKAIATNKILGLFVNYGGSKFEQSSGNVTTVDKTQTYGGGIFLRNYYTLSPRFYLFGEAGLGVTSSNRERTSNSILTSEDNTTGISLTITPGISFAAGKKLHLEASLNNLFSMDYSASKSKYYDNSGVLTSSNKGTSFNAAANASGFSQISVGLRWILPSKQ
jgi:hypothetical protein